MGRGRAKAKQTKVARELKYSSPTTDYDALQRELGGGNGHSGSAAPPAAPDPGESEDDEDDRWASSR